MIPIIPGTNREGSTSVKLAYFYKELLTSFGEEADVLEMRDLPDDFIFSALYGNQGSSELYNSYIKTIEENEKLIFVVPEYNGSFPGVLKAFIDGLRYPHTLKGKKAAMVGLSAGNMGSALALSHLADILNYAGTHVLANRPRLSFIGKHFDGKEFSNALYRELLEIQAGEFLEF